MNEEPFHPSPELRARLDAVALTSRDWVLYCPRCSFVGEVNAAYATAFMRNHALRIWRGSDNTAPEAQMRECSKLVLDVGQDCAEPDEIDEIEDHSDASVLVEWRDAKIAELHNRLQLMRPVYEAALKWRHGRDRNIIGTAPSGGTRSATGIALIDAIDAAITIEKAK